MGNPHGAHPHGTPTRETPTQETLTRDISTRRHPHGTYPHRDTQRHPHGTPTRRHPHGTPTREMPTRACYRAQRAELPPGIPPGPPGLRLPWCWSHRTGDPGIDFLKTRNSSLIDDGFPQGFIGFLWVMSGLVGCGDRRDGPGAAFASSRGFSDRLCQCPRLGFRFWSCWRAGGRAVRAPSCLPGPVCHTLCPGVGSVGSVRSVRSVPASP